MFSLLHFLASHPRNADTLKRALHGDADARRLFSFLGVTPTHLESIDEGAIARRSAAVSVPRTVEVMASASCADRLAEAEEAIRVLRDRAESAESASEHGPLTDLLVITGRKVETFYLPKAPEECRYGVSVEGYLHTHGATPREALIRMRDQVRERLAQTTPKPEQTPPEEVIVLGPWTDVHDDGRKVRLILNGPRKNSEGLCIIADDRNIWLMLQPDVGYGPDGGYETRYDQCEQDAETAARKTYALIDAEPGSLLGTIPAWRSTHDRYHEAKWDSGFILIDDHSGGLWACPGWRIVVATPAHPKGTTIAEGPQTGEEGKRYALAAAHALGLTGGGE